MEYLHQKSPIKLDIIVVGAGLGGLSASVAASLSGHRVTVFESVKELREVGAGLQVTPNATKILQRWSVPDWLWQLGAEPTSFIVHRYSGQILAEESHFGEKMRAKYGAPFIELHRVDLQMALLERAKQLGVEIMFGQKVISIDFDLTEIRTTLGLTAKADLIIAADGLWSECRACYTQKNDLPQPTGDLAYRVVLDLDQVPDRDLQLWISNPTVHSWIGHGSHAVGYSLRAGCQYNIVLLVPDDLPEGVSRQPGAVKEMKSLFDGWDPILRRFLNLVSDVDKWKLMYRGELGSWVNEKANLVFLGDACHPMLPYLAQGANSAIEDGAVLGLLIGHLKSKDQLPQALRLYEKLRKARGDAIVRETFKQREQFHMPDGPEQVARDKVFLSQLGKELKGPFPSKLICPDVQPWLFGYDAYQAVEAALQEEPLDEIKI